MVILLLSFTRGLARHTLYVLLSLTRYRKPDVINKNLVRKPKAQKTN